MFEGKQIHRFAVQQIRSYLCNEEDTVVLRFFLLSH
jgi:hypothetical protein